MTSNNTKELDVIIDKKISLLAKELEKQVIKQSERLHKKNMEELIQTTLSSIQKRSSRSSSNALNSHLEKVINNNSGISGLGNILGETLGLLTQQKLDQLLSSQDQTVTSTETNRSISAYNQAKGTSRARSERQAIKSLQHSQRNV